MSRTTAAFSSTANLEQQSSQLNLAYTPWEYNWDKDQQAGNKTVKEYVAIAEDLSSLLVPRVQQMIERVAQTAGVQTSGIKIMDQNLVKSEESAERKLYDPRVGGVPSKIGDYLRTKIVVPSGKNAIPLINALREEVITSPDTTSYRDNFRRPCPEGYHVGFKSHMQISSGGQSIKAEVQIAHASMEYGPNAEAAHILRDNERALSRLVMKPEAMQLSRAWAMKMKEVHGVIQQLRQAVHLDTIRRERLDILFDPGVNIKDAFNDEGLRRSVVQSLVKDTGRKATGPAIADVVKILSPTSTIGSHLALIANKTSRHHSIS